MSVEELNNEDAINFLVGLKGVGPWTAEMFLMFAYRRMDVFSMGDIALRRAVSEIYKGSTNVWISKQNGYVKMVLSQNINIIDEIASQFGEL